MGGQQQRGLADPEEELRNYQKLCRGRALSAERGPALQHLPSRQTNDSFAVSLFAAPAAGDLRAHAKEFASAWIAELKVDRRVPHAQAAAWATSNAVFAETTHNENMFAK